MFSSEEYHCVLKIAAGSCKGCIIFANFNNNKLFPSSSKKKHFIKLVFLVGCVFLSLLSVFRVYYFHVFDDSKYRRAKLAWNLTICWGYTCVSLVCLCFHLKNAILIDLFNHLLQCMCRVGIDGEITKLRKLFISAQYFLLIIALGSSAFVVAIEVHFIWVLVENGYVDYWCMSLMVPTGIYAVWFMMSGAMMFQLLLMYMYIYYLVVTFVIAKLPTNISGETESLSGVSGIQNTVEEYRSLILLTNMFNNSFGKSVTPILKIFLSFLAILGLVAGVKVRSELDSNLISLLFISTSFYSGILVNVLANMSCSIWTKANYFICIFLQLRSTTAVKEREMRKYIHLCADSFCPLRMTVGGFYFMEKEAKLTLAGFLVTGGANALTALKEY